jgi:cystathionine beta-lyase/cystathionine gamma-synthase
MEEKIKLKNNNFYAHFASIPVPEDAYLLLNGMRALQIDLQEITANGIRQDKV